ncbi:MAG TPA: hypothetical protein VFH90_08485, partial [Candidatus Limnocylindria bacterium]|nr:hypothetical protein [Candidatus Limnocylindria bacterium]
MSPAIRVWLFSVSLAILASVLYLVLIGNEPPLAVPFQIPWWIIAAGFALADIKVIEVHFRRGERATRDGLQIGFRLETANEVDAWAQELGQRGFALVAPPSGDRWEGMRSFRVA